MNTNQDIRDILALLSEPEELWLLEEQAEFGETELDIEEVYRQLSTTIRDGQLLHLSPESDLGEDYA